MASTSVDFLPPKRRSTFVAFAVTARHAEAVIDVEFWPDYGAGPLWVDGRAVSPVDLGLTDALSAELSGWNAAYEESKIPLEGAGDQEWLAEGRRLLGAVRQALGPEYDVGANEDWWEELPT